MTDARRDERSCCGDISDEDAARLAREADERPVLTAEESGYVLGWRAWYDSPGAVHDSRTTRWEDLPEDGLLVVMLYFRDGTKRVVMGNNFYFRAPARTGGFILDGDNVEVAESNIAARYPGASVKRGRFAEDGFYRKVVDEAMASVWE